MENKNTLASEIINDLRNTISTSEKKLERLHEDTRAISAIFGAVYYASCKNILSGETLNSALLGVGNMLNVLDDNMTDLYGETKNI